MALGETILSRRKALALTQEQVAERLGVTPQAVYKWEKGLACPDVQLLSPLARLLETDLNTLFAYNTEPDKVELSALIERVSHLALQKDGQPAAFAEAHAALRKYPASAQLRLSMAIVLEGALVARGGGDEERQREVYALRRAQGGSCPCQSRSLRGYAAGDVGLDLLEGDAQGYGELAVEQGLGALHEARVQLGEVPLVTGFGVHARDGVYERLRLLPADDRAHEYLRVHGYAYCAAVYYEFTHLVHFGLTRHFPGLLAA